MNVIPIWKFRLRYKDYKNTKYVKNLISDILKGFESEIQYTDPHVKIVDSCGYIYFSINKVRTATLTISHNISFHVDLRDKNDEKLNNMIRAEVMEYLI